MPASAYNRVCMHCGSVGAERIGYCDHCGTAVCAKCGNTQISRGNHKILHDSCLKECSDDSFTMIKFRK